MKDDDIREFRDQTTSTDNLIIWVRRNHTTAAAPHHLARPEQLRMW
jgi:hypothetical protein